ncbi:MAG TPA: hypothetical protein VMV10_04150 [Pirellulales bacterium]|nr:hypothetical protein [Pirellulales bacterium]
MSAVESPGCVILLLDESAGMGAVMGEVVSDGKASTKSNADRVATAINALLNQLAAGPDFPLALVGYQSDGAGQANVGSRFGGALAGRDFVSTAELRGAPLRVESRTRKIPAPGGLGVAREEAVEFPLWYEPRLGSKAPQIAAYDYCRGLLERWSAEAGPNPGVPLVVHVSSGASGDGNPQVAVSKLLELATPAGPPLVLQAHLAAAAAVASSLYPSSYVYLTLGSARDLFRRASVLPPPLAETLREAKATVNAGARGLIYNAKISDVIRLLGLVKAHASRWAAAVPAQQAAAEVASPAVAAPLTMDELAPIPLSEEPAGNRERAALVVLVLDRSAADPFSGGVQKPFFKLQDQANDVLKQISKLGELAVAAAVVSYGVGAAGEAEIHAAFDGPLAAKTFARPCDLAEGAIRVEQFEEQVSNGVGGLVSVTRKKPIYFDLEPTTGAPPLEAVAAAARIVADWTSQHPTACLAPIVLHLTRGYFDPSEIEQAAAALADVQTSAGPVTLYHWVATETPHKSLVYPADESELEDPALRKLFETSSPLLARERLSQEKPSISADARGLVINGKFDALLEGVKDALAAS